MRVVRTLCLLAAILLGACTTTNLEAGKELAIAGKTAAAVLQKDAKEAAVEYRKNTRRSALLTLLGRAENPNVALVTPQPDRKGFEGVAAALSARASMLEKLVDLYANLEEGMTYDAGEETRSAFGGFLNAVDGYRQAVGAVSGQPLAERPQASAIGQILGLFAHHIQERKMREASALVRAELLRVREALLAERQAAASARKTNALLPQRLQDALRRQGLADPNPMLDELVALAGAAKAADAAKAYNSKPRLQQALTIYQQWDNEEFKLMLIESSYEKSLEVFDELRLQHERFEKGEPLSLAQLMMKAEQLRAITELLIGKD